MPSSEPGRPPGQPLRIVITGGSVSLYVTPARTGREDGNYGELLPRLLAPHGITADVRHTGKWFDLIDELRRRYETAVRNQFPDVLVMNYGMGECQYNLVPTWLTRHISTWDTSSRPAARFYRRRVVPRLWRMLRGYQRAMARSAGRFTYRLPPKRFRLEMERVITLARIETGCLVLVLDCDPPGPRFTHWMPGMDERWADYQRLLQEMVTGLDDPMVRLVPASKTITDELGFEVGLPDSIHRSVVGHRRTAELLVAEILDWQSRSTG